MTTMTADMITLENPTEALGAAYARLNRAVAQEAPGRELVGAAIGALAVHAQVFFPRAAAVALGWSDQGDWLTCRALLDAEGNPVDRDPFTDESDEMNDIAANFEDANLSTWQPRMSLVSLDGTGYLYRLDLRAACAACGSDRADIRNPGIVADFGPDAVCCEIPVG